MNSKSNVTSSPCKNKMEVRSWAYNSFGCVQMAAIVKVDVRKSPPVRGCLWGGFLGLSSSAVPVDPQPTPDGLVHSLGLSSL
jgi:hypothetical protein